MSRPSRLAAAMIRLAISLRAGDHSAAAAAAAQAEILVSRVPGDKLARHPEIRARVLASRGAAELWSGRLDEAAHVLDLAVGAATGPVGERERAHCLGHLALVEALRGRLRRAAKLAAQATAAHADQERPPAQHPNPAALVALAWVHLERDELRETHRRLKQADAALGVSPDQLIGAMACLAAAGAILADGRAAAAVQIIARARSGWSAGLARAQAEPDRIAGTRHRRRHPGSTGRSRARRPRLAGGGGRDRARMVGRRKPAQCRAGARARPDDRESGA